jgi:hypothetical protein
MVIDWVLEVLLITTYVLDCAGTVIVRVTVPPAVHRMTAYCELLPVKPVVAYVPVVTAKVMSASVEIV